MPIQNGLKFIPCQSQQLVKTVDVFRQMFAAHGLPEQLVSDNGPQFTSEEFSHFMKCNGVRHIRVAPYHIRVAPYHIRVAPYHPASNGLAEQFVQSLKQALKASAHDGRTLSQRLCSFLLTYRTTAHATTGVSPCSLFLKQDLRTRLDLLRPDRRSHVLHKQSLQKDSHDRKAQDRSWFLGQTVRVRNLRPGPDWVTGVIVERLGPRSYLVETGTHQFWKRHVDQLKEVADSPLTSDEFRTVPDWEYVGPTSPSVDRPTTLSHDSATDSGSTTHPLVDVDHSTFPENLRETPTSVSEDHSNVIPDQQSDAPVSPWYVDTLSIIDTPQTNTNTVALFNALVNVSMFYVSEEGCGNCIHFSFLCVF